MLVQRSQRLLHEQLHVNIMLMFLVPLRSLSVDYLTIISQQYYAPFYFQVVLFTTVSVDRMTIIL